MEEEGFHSFLPWFIAFACFVIAITLLLALYRWLAGGQRRRPPPDSSSHENTSCDDLQYLSTVQLIPAYKYSAGEVAPAVVGADNSTCAVCLSEFKEGEDVRLLPECLHCFHVACIDMWLYSHSSCPLCRTAALGLHDPPRAQVPGGRMPALVGG